MAEDLSFLQVPGVPGAATDPKHKGWIEVVSHSAPAGQQKEVDFVYKKEHPTYDMLTKAVQNRTQLGTVVIEHENEHTLSRLTLEGARAIRNQYNGLYALDDQTQLGLVTFVSEKKPKTETIQKRKPSQGKAPVPPKPVNPKQSPTTGGSAGIKQAVLHVRVVDEKGAERVPKGKDKVTVSGTALKYDAKDGFVHPLNGKGNLLLKVEYDGFEPLEQPFHYEAPAKRPTLIPFWHGTDADPEAKGRTREGYLLACMNLARTAGGYDDQRSPKVFNLTATLHPTRMYIAVCGTDYWEGALTARPKRKSLDFTKYAVTYAKHLTAVGMLNLSSPFNLLDCQSGRVERWERVAGRGWRKHLLIDQLEPAPAWPGAADFVAWRARLTPATATKYLGAPYIYGHLSAIGQFRPGVVADFSVFSHAWQGGPILFNTLIDETKRVRDEKDLDMRYLQDFEPASVSGWPHMPKAFASDAAIHIWGCFDTDKYEQMARFLLGNNGNSARFFNQEDNLSMDRPMVAKWLRDTIANNSYMSAIAKYTKRRTFGGLPGFGADNLDYDSIPTVPQRLKNAVDGPFICVPIITRQQQFRKLFESAELGARRFDEFGYMLYQS